MRRKVNPWLSQLTLGACLIGAVMGVSAGRAPAAAAAAQTVSTWATMRVVPNTVQYHDPVQVSFIAGIHGTYVPLNIDQSIRVKFQLAAKGVDRAGIGWADSPSNNRDSPSRRFAMMDDLSLSPGRYAVRAVFQPDTLRSGIHWEQTISDWVYFDVLGPGYAANIVRPIDMTDTVFPMYFNTGWVPTEDAKYMSTEITISKNGRLDAVTRMMDRAYLAGMCGSVRAFLLDRNKNVLQSFEPGQRWCVDGRAWGSGLRTDYWGAQIQDDVLAATEYVSILHNPETKPFGEVLQQAIPVIKAIKAAVGSGG